MKKSKMAALLYFICGIVWGICAIINAYQHNITMETLFVLMALFFVMLGGFSIPTGKHEEPQEADVAE